MEKVEQERHISSHDNGMKRNIDHKTILVIWRRQNTKKTRCLCATWFNSEKLIGLNFHLWIIAKTEQNQTIF